MSLSNNYETLKQHHEHVIREIERMKPDRHKKTREIICGTATHEIDGEIIECAFEAEIGWRLTDQNEITIAIVHAEADADLFLSRIGPLEKSDVEKLAAKRDEIQAHLERHPDHPKQ